MDSSRYKHMARMFPDIIYCFEFTGFKFVGKLCLLTQKICMSRMMTSAFPMNSAAVICLQIY